MWRNFGEVVIRGPDEGKLIDYGFFFIMSIDSSV